MFSFPKISWGLAAIALLAWVQRLAAGPAAWVPAEIDIYPQVPMQAVGSGFVGVNLPAQIADKRLLVDTTWIERLKSLGVRSVRFPAGCSGDSYNWKEPAPGTITLDEFLDFCAALGAEPVYVLNLQGGTEGVEGAAPAGAPLYERIRHRHSGANACGHTEFYYGTLAEAGELISRYSIDRAQTGKLAIAHYELGSGNWSQAAGDWTPEVYSKTVELYVDELLRRMVEDQPADGKGSPVVLYLSLCGYPFAPAGLPAATQPSVNAAWTREVNRIAESGKLDVVYEPLPLGDTAAISNPATAIQVLVETLAARQPKLLEEGEAPDTERRYAVPLEFVQADTACSPFTVDLLATLLEHGVPHAFAARLYGDDACSLLKPDGSVNSTATAVLELLAGRIGDQVVKADVNIIHAGAGAGIPALAATATRQGDEVFIILVNRTADQAIEARLHLRGCEVADGDWRELLPLAAPAAKAGMQTGKLSAGSPLVRTVAPMSAQVLRVPLVRVSEIPLNLNLSVIERSVCSWCAVSDDRFEIATTPYQPILYQIRTDAPWLKVTPTVGRVSVYQAQPVQVSYETGQLGPGTHEATLQVTSPEAYNSPQSIRVRLTLRPPRADFDGDGDVDQLDLTHFQVCMMSPPQFQSGPTCAHARLDDDDDVDFDDYSQFLFCMSGADNRPGPQCVE